MRLLWKKLCFWKLRSFRLVFINVGVRFLFLFIFFCSKCAGCNVITCTLHCFQLLNMQFSVVFYFGHLHFCVFFLIRHEWSECYEIFSFLTYCNVIRSNNTIHWRSPVNFVLLPIRSLFGIFKSYVFFLLHRIGFKFNQFTKVTLI